MPDYAAYIEAAGIKPGQFTGAIREQFPKFSKIQKSMICAPDRYGLQLVPDAEALLTARFGRHPGLACTDPRPARKKPRPVRSKPCRLVVYLPEDVNDRVRALMQRRGYETVQEFLCTILTNLVNIEERKENPA